MDICYEKPKPEDYVSLRIRSGMGSKDLERSRIALENSLFTAALYDGDTLIGFGRIVGDAGVTFVVSDIMVDEGYRRQGFADMIMGAVDTYFDENTFEDSYIFLIANHPADLLYGKYHFEYLSENKYGMMRKQKSMGQSAD